MPSENRIMPLTLSRKLLLACLIAAPLAPTGAFADTLLLETVDSAAGGAERPRNGLTMTSVRSRFGEPESERPAEHDRVITSVARC